MKYQINDKKILELKDEIVNFIKDGSTLSQIEQENKFNELCLKLFEIQFNAIDGYKKYCKSKNISPENVTHYTQIPPIPTLAFKQSDIFIFDKSEAVLTFKTSGTSKLERGVAYFSKVGVEILNIAILENARNYLFPDNLDCRFFLIAPPPSLMPELTMAYGINLLMNNIGTLKGKHYINENGILFNELINDLKLCEKDKIPCVIIAPSFALVTILDKLNEQKIKFNLAYGSRILDAGGFKGRSREVVRSEMLKYIEEVFNIKPYFCVNTLGMSELSSQYYDNNLKNFIQKNETNSITAKENPFWAKTFVVKIINDEIEFINKNDYESKGALLHIDISNFDRAVSILTDDLGKYLPNGFEILGRIKSDDLKGCSLTIEELINKN